MMTEAKTVEPRTEWVTRIQMLVQMWKQGVDDMICLKSYLADSEVSSSIMTGESLTPIVFTILS